MERRQGQSIWPQEVRLSRTSPEGQLRTQDRLPAEQVCGRTARPPGGVTPVSPEEVHLPRTPYPGGPPLTHSRLSSQSPFLSLAMKLILIQCPSGTGPEHFQLDPVHWSLTLSPEYNRTDVLALKMASDAD